MEIWVVFDRRPSKEEQAANVASTDSRIQVHYAPSADDWIVEQVAMLVSHRAVTVVTADRPLRERVRRAGGTLCSPRQFLADCQSS
jgi:predicted RNA-binding protein with PIN domain